MKPYPHDCADHETTDGTRCRDCGSLRTWCQLCRDETTQHTDCPYA